VKQHHFIITIDGPAGSGKSSTAKLVASALKIGYLDSGAMYRALALKAFQQGINLQDLAVLIEMAQTTRIDLVYENSEMKVLLDGQEVTAAIRQPTVSRIVPLIAAIPEIREIMVELQRSVAQNQSLVAEGRDMGTVVFPDADVKIFMKADLEVRAQRRFLELKYKNILQPIEEIREEIKQRDQMDAERAISPLVKADDAIECDTSVLTLEEQVEFILKKVRNLSR